MSAPTTLDDAQLVNAIQDGNNELISVLADRYVQLVYNIVRKRAPASDVEDLTQDILLAVVRSIHTFNQDSSLRTWIHAIINNKLRYYYRQRKVRSRISSFSSVDGGGDDETNAVDARVEGGDDPTEVVAQADENAIVLEALEELKEDYREVLYLRFTDELSFAEIAEHLKLSLDAVKSRYRRAVAAVRKKLRRLKKQ
ncbi:MAG: RNA polymerase sigma factor [Planctomycetes bacterium]|nr:RNA polymerase sigma factor [Planctomycetota bacterium]